MNRRIFLTTTTGALGWTLLRVSATGQEKQKAPASNNALNPGSLISDLESLIPKLMKEYSIPGLSIALVHEAKLAWSKGFGVKDTESKLPVDGDTLFEAASISKTVFAYAVMKLCEKGVIGLDTPLTKYGTRRFLEGDSRLDLITARYVLSHTSGFQDWRSRTEPLKIHFNPGSQFRYSGEGYFYLQSIVSQLTGKTDPAACSYYEAGVEVCGTDIDASMKRNLLEPFGMASSGYIWNDRFQKHAARPHNELGKPLTTRKPGTPDAARYGSAGGLHTTASEYARFMLEVIAPKPADAFRLNAASLHTMLRPQIKLQEDQKIDGASSWALGWAVQERKNGNVILHSGGQAGFRSLAMASVDRKSGYVILTNGESGHKIFMNETFAALVNKLLPA